jgi:hypothetical protein
MVADAGVMGQQKADPTLFHIPTHHHVVGPLKHLCDLALGSSTPIQPRHGDQNLIAIKDLIHLSGGEKQILATLQWSRKTISITVTHDSAPLQVHSPRHSIRTAATGDNLSVTLHGSQPLTQGVEVPILIQRQLPCNRLQPKRCVGRFQ